MGVRYLMFGDDTGRWQPAFRLWVEPDQQPTALIPGDVNADGRVDLTDFGILKENFGRTIGAAVPEPSGLCLGLTAAGLACLMAGGFIPRGYALVRMGPDGGVDERLAERAKQLNREFAE